MDFKDIFKDLFVPLFTGLLGYYFALRSKNNDLNIEKNKIKNRIHADLLEVKYYKENMIRFFKMMESDEEKSMFPKELILKAINSDKKLNPDCFENAEKSIQELKSYDPKLFNNLAGIGRTFNDFIHNPQYKYLRDTSILDPILKQFYITFLNGIDRIIENAIEMVDNEWKFLKKLKSIWPFKEKEGSLTETNLEDINRQFIKGIYKSQDKEINDEEFTKLLNSINPQEFKDLRNIMNIDISTFNFEKLSELRRLYPNKTEAELIEMLRNGEV